MTEANSETSTFPTLSCVETEMLTHMPDADNMIAQAAIYHLSSGGSRVRAGLALKAASALDIDPVTACAISSACELLHNASLVHDDLQDRDAFRRGQMAVWKKFGVNTAICLGDMMVSAAYAAISRAPSEILPALITHMHRRVSDVIGGQHADLESACQSVEAYNDIARMKSGPLLGLPVELCLIAAHASSHLDCAIQASDAIAIAYQVTDDLSDAADDLASGGLNFLALLEGDMTRKRAAALQHAAYHAEAAIRLAERLPCHAGKGLRQLADKFIPSRHMGAAA